MSVIVRGVKDGIEKFSKVMMPLLLLIICVLVVCSFSMPGSSEGLAFLLRPDFSKVDGKVVLDAMGPGFLFHECRHGMSLYVCFLFYA